MSFVDVFNHYRSAEDAKSQFLATLKQYVHDRLDATKRQDLVITEGGKFVQMFRYMPNTDTVVPAGGSVMPVLIALESLNAS
jgi:hypothetical protein